MSEKPGPHACTTCDRNVCTHVNDAFAAAVAERDRLKLENAGLLAALKAMVDPYPCDHFDHHGYCQTHSQTDSPCAHAVARAAIARAEGRSNG